MEHPRAYAEVFRLIVLFGILAVAAYGDLRDSRIPNWLSLGAVVLGLALGVATGGLAGLARSVWGLVAGGGPLLVVYLIGLAGGRPLMGAGDVKLMAGIGALVGPLAVVWSIFYALWIAGALALILVGARALRGGVIPKTLPFGACLAGGTLVAFLLRSNAFGAIDRL